MKIAIIVHDLVKLYLVETNYSCHLKNILLQMQELHCTSVSNYNNHVFIADFIITIKIFQRQNTLSQHYYTVLSRWWNSIIILHWFLQLVQAF